MSPYKCPAGSDCIGEQICEVAPAECTPGLFCPGFTIINESVVSGALPDLCPKGYYCPIPSSKYRCPSGYFCPAGTSSPRTCSTFSLCPEGSSYPEPYLGAALTLFIPIIVLGALFGYSHIRDSKRMQRDERRASTVVDADNRVSLLAEADRVSDDCPQMNISFNNVCFDVGSKRILNKVTAEIRSGRCVCIMGPSGAGKTTFLSALMGKIVPSSGSILFNGKNATVDSLRSIVGFVPQDDNMIRILTAKETLQYCVAYRLPASPEQRSRLVNETLRSLGLFSVRHVLIGDELNRGISGGQRKRVNIGMELVADPLLLFLDEPTTGLDASASAEVVSALVRIASSGRIVATVIHQPRAESYTLFDDLILLAKGGYVAYAGPVKEATSYFEGLGYKLAENCNPADFVMDVVSGKVERAGGAPYGPAELAEFWEQHRSSVQSLSHQVPSEFAVVQQRDLPSLLWQFVVFIRRCTVQTVRDFRSLFIASFIQFLGGFMIGSASEPSQGPLYLPPVSGTIGSQQCPFIIRDRCVDEPVSQGGLTANIFYLSMACGVAAVARSVSTFGEEKNVIKRESITGRSYVSYALAKMVVDIPIILYGTLLFCSVYMALALPSGSFWGYFISFLGMQFAASGFGYFVSIICSNDDSMVVSIVSAIAFAVCSGWIPTLKDVRDSFPFLQVLWALSYARWGGEAIYINEVHAYRKDFYVEGGFKKTGFNSSMFDVDILMMFIIGLVWRVFAVAAMRFKLESKMRS